MPSTNRYPEIDEIVAYIHRHLHEPLPLSRLAGHVAYSPFHFTRIFKERIGLPPLYYVSSLRLQRAKDLLLRTTLSVRDIGLEIGQMSLGTFTSRFTDRVGVPPADFRSSAHEADERLRELRRLGDWTERPRPWPSYGSITGTVEAEAPVEGIVLVGLFAKPIPEGMPLYGTVLPSAGTFALADVKPGIYFLMATSVSWQMGALDMLLPRATLRSRDHAPVSVEPYKQVPHQHVTLHPPRLDDPPILISLPLLMNNFLNRMSQTSNR